MKKINLILIGLFLTLCNTSLAQINLAELANMIGSEDGYNKLVKKKMVQHADNALKYPSGYKKIINTAFQFKRVGILSINLKYGDFGSNLSSKEANEIINHIKPKIEQQVKEQGEKQNIEILTPDAYLANENVKKAYTALGNYNITVNGKVTAAKNYETVYLGSTNVPQLDKKLAKAMGEFLTQANLDACIIININAGLGKLQKDGKKDVKNNIEKAFRFHSVSSNVILKNQNSYDSSVKYPKILGGYIGAFASAWSIVTRGGLSIREYQSNGKGGSAIKLIQTNDYSKDLENVIGNFSKYIIEQAIYSKDALNKKNKLE